MAKEKNVYLQQFLIINLAKLKLDPHSCFSRHPLPILTLIFFLPRLWPSRSRRRPPTQSPRAQLLPAVTVPGRSSRSWRYEHPQAAIPEKLINKETTTLFQRDFLHMINAYSR
jgi:hypothetical protein